MAGNVVISYHFEKKIKGGHWETFIEIGGDKKIKIIKINAIKEIRKSG